MGSVKSIPSHDKKTLLPYEPIHSKNKISFIYSDTRLFQAVFFLAPSQIQQYNNTIPKTENGN